MSKNVNPYIKEKPDLNFEIRKCKKTLLGFDKYRD